MSSSRLKNEYIQLYTAQSHREFCHNFPEFPDDEATGNQDKRNDDGTAQVPYRRNGSISPPPLASIAAGRSTVENVEGSCMTSAPSSIFTRREDTVSTIRQTIEAYTSYYEPSNNTFACSGSLTCCSMAELIKNINCSDPAIISCNDWEDTNKLIESGISILIDCEKNKANVHFLDDPLNTAQYSLVIDVFQLARIKIDRSNQPVKCGHSHADADFPRMGIIRVPRWPGLLQNTSPISGSDRRQPKCRRYRPFVVVVVSCLLPVAAAGVWAPQLRIGAGFAGFALGVVPIPLRRDERVKPTSLIPIYLLSLACTAIFITSQYYSIIRGRGQYLFGTFVLAAHFVGVLSQATDNMLDGIVDIGPALLPAVAALVSVLFPRHQPSLFRYPRRAPVRIQETITGTAVEDPQIPEEADIALERLTQLSHAVAGLIPTNS